MVTNYIITRDVKAGATCYFSNPYLKNSYQKKFCF